MRRVTYAVTTRSHLRSVRFFVPMLRASLRIRKQLRDTDGCLRFASIIMGPREFWTITIWRTRQEMLDFMRSGAHEDIMWEFGHWLDSFWLMRWRPSERETGGWEGLHLAQRPELPQASQPRSKEQQRALDAALKSIPRLRAAAAPSGAASFEYAPAQRRARARVAGGVGATLRLDVPDGRDAPLAWFKLRRLHRSLLGEDDVLRCAFGASGPGELFLLAVLRHDRAYEEFESRRDVAELHRRWPERVWTMRWDAENEFGHWDGLRLRRARLGYMIDVPDEARRAAETDAR